MTMTKSEELKTFRSTMDRIAPGLQQSLIDAGVIKNMHEGIILWITRGIVPGSFLKAVIKNDLAGAVMYADQNSLQNLVTIVQWFYTHAPRTCWQSGVNFIEWHKRHNPAQYEDDDDHEQG